MIRINNKGFTLIEIIISIAILGILFVTFITIFTSGISWISRAGFKSESISTEQVRVEQRLITVSNVAPVDDTSLEFDFDGDASNIDVVVLGNFDDAELPTESAGQKSKLITFIPFVEIGNDDEIAPTDETHLLSILNSVDLNPYIQNKTAIETDLDIVSTTDGVTFEYISAESDVGTYMVIEDTPHRIEITRQNNQQRTGTIRLEATYNGIVKFRDFTITIPSKATLGPITIY